jgi:hypothetical protein
VDSKDAGAILKTPNANQIRDLYVEELREGSLAQVSDIGVALPVPDSSLGQAHRDRRGTGCQLVFPGQLCSFMQRLFLLIHNIELPVVPVDAFIAKGLSQNKCINISSE